MSLIRPKSLRDLALEHLRNQIIEGNLKLGQFLSERKIADDLGVSKSPVREALAQLREEGLVIIEPQKGVRVFTLTENEVAQICDFRQAIETAAFDLAIKRSPDNLANDMEATVTKMEAAQNRGDMKRYLALDTEFHHLIFKHCQNTYLSASYERYIGKISALRTHLAGLPDHTKLSFDEHKKILQAVRERDTGKIAALLKTHIDRTRETYTQSLHLLENVNASSD